MRQQQWMTSARDVGVVRVAQWIGLKVKSNRLSPCPACGATTERNIRRAPVGIRDGGLRWSCNHSDCEAGGDTIDMVAHHLNLAPLEGRASWAAVEAFFAQNGVGAGPLEEADLQPVLREVHRPPLDEIRAVLEASTPVGRTRRQDVIAALAALPGLAGLDRADVPAWVLPAAHPVYDTLSVGPNAQEPLYGGQRRRWLYPSLVKNFPLATPMYDAQGRLSSLHFRSIVPRKDKTRNAYGYDTVGLFMADPWQGVPMLRGEATEVVEVLLGEGCSDFWALAARVKGNPRRAAVSIVSGSAHGLLEVKWPAGSRGISLVDFDEQGARYHRKLVEATAPWPIFRPEVSA